MGAATNGNAANVSVNSISGLQKVNVDGSAASATASTAASLTANLPSNPTVVAAADLPSTNTAGAHVYGRDLDDGL